MSNSVAPSLAAGYRHGLASMRRWLPLAGLVLLLALFGRAAPTNTQAAASRLLPPERTLRVAFDLGKDGLTVNDPVTGELQGIEVNLGRALAAQLGRTFVPVEYRTGSIEGLRIYQGLKRNEWDVAFLPVDPQYTDRVDYSTAYIDVGSTYLVPPGSSIQTAADVDRPGMRVVVQDGAAPDRFLTDTLKQARIERADDLKDAVYFMQHGGADAIASDLPTLLQLAQQIPGSRILSDSFMVTRQAIAVPKGGAALLARVTSFVEQAKADGTVAREIQNSGDRAVRVAPPAIAGPQPAN